MNSISAQSGKIEWIDNLKVITMLLVIIGHSTYLVIDTPYGKTPYANDTSIPVYSIVHRLIGALTVFIYSFHMPLFMSISGMCFNLSMRKNPTWGAIVKGKTHRLLMPFILVALLYSIPIKYFSGYFNSSENILEDVFLGQILLLGNSHLWYVMSLFWIFIMYYFIEKVKIKKNFLFWCTLFVLSLIGLYCSRKFNLLGIPSAFKHLLFFAIGYNCFERINNWNPKLFMPLLALVGVFILQRFTLVLSDIGIAGKVISYFSYPVMAIIGGGSMILIIKYLHNFINRISILKLFKRYTYELYLYSDPLNYILITIAYITWGMEVYSSNTLSLGLYISRIVLTTLGALLVTEIIQIIRNKNKIFRLR